MNNSKYYPLFKSYDVRGTYPQIDATLAYWVAYAFVKEVLEVENLPKEVAIVHDCRMSSPELYKAIYNGIKDAGANPLPLGLGSTDMMYASTQLFNCAGIMITASHNPPADNGIKIVKKAPQALGVGTGLEKIRDSKYFENPAIFDIANAPTPVENEIKKTELLEFYSNKLTEIGQIESIKDKLETRKLKVVVDTGNGMGGYVIQQIKKLYPQIDFIPLFWELDGTYPNHQADPTVEKNLEDLKKAIKENRADLGIGFDGDADRAVFVDENAQTISGDYTVATIAKAMLKRYFSKDEKLTSFTPTIVYNYPASRCTKDITESMGGKAVASKQGHNFMKAALSSEKGIYGGEQSGHNYFGEFCSMDGGAFAVVSILNILVTNNQTPSQLVEDLRKKYLLSGERNFKLEGDIDTKSRIDALDVKLKEKYNNAEFNYLDGITVLYPDWKLNIRLSNTEPLLRLNVELINNDGTKTLEDVEKLVNEIKETLSI